MQYSSTWKKLPEPGTEKKGLTGLLNPALESGIGHYHSARFTPVKSG
jgi:hypothetical protein